MFSRIRYAAEVLSYCPPKIKPYDQPDIVFKEEERLKIPKSSEVIGTLFEIFLISTVIGAASAVCAPFMHFLYTAKTSVGLVAITGFAASLLSIIGMKILDTVNTHLRLQLKIGEKIAPYFGHKIARTIHILRG